MSNEPVLTHLIEQAEAAGAARVTLRAIVEEAGELGAMRALKHLGLEDAQAARDMGELRQLLGAWRDAKKSALKAAIGWLVRLGLALVLIGLAVRTGFSEWVK